MRIAARKAVGVQTDPRHQAARPALGVAFDDAGAPYADQPFGSFEWTQLTDLGFRLTRMTLAKYTDAADFDSDMNAVDAVYLSGGHTFVLLGALQGNGTGEVLKARVRAGLPYVGLSAGSVVAGPNVEPVAPLDDPADAPGVTDYTGLGLVDTVVIPHADGALPPYPPAMIDEVVFDGAATLSSAEEEVGDDFVGEAGEDIDFNAGGDAEVGGEMPE